MDENANTYSAKNLKTYLQEPSIFVVYPEIASEEFKTMAALKNIPFCEQYGTEFESINRVFKAFG